MLGRGLTYNQIQAISAPSFPAVYFVRLDIKDDPVIVWTGGYDYAPTNTGLPGFDGQVFTGVGNIGDIGAITDTNAGSDTLTITLPGVNTDDPALREVIDNRTYQNRDAYVWMGALDANFALVDGKPWEFRKGRMDTITVKIGGPQGTVEVTIESYATQAGAASETRYDQQKSIDPSDISQDFVQALANKEFVLGPAAATSTSSSTATGMGGGVSGPGLSSF